MEGILNEEIGGDHNVEGEEGDVPVVCVCEADALQALNDMKTGKSHGHSDVSLELVAARV